MQTGSRLRTVALALGGSLVLVGCFDTWGTGMPAGRWDTYRADLAGFGDVPEDLAAVDLVYDPAAPDAMRDLALGDPSEGATDIGGDYGGGGGCWPCSSDADCRGNQKCVPIGATKSCLTTCGNDGDCPPSYICYAASTANKSCLPVSYSCPACVRDVPCDAGKVCDMTSGDCRDGHPECGVCTYDFDCSDGMRCYKKDGSATGWCVAGCSDAKPCADTARFTCGTTPRGVRLCMPNSEASCIGDCSSDRPFKSDDGLSCWECWNNSNCDVSSGEQCIPTTHTCGFIDCVRYVCDGSCYECCQDPDCPGDTGPCIDHRCSNKLDECQGQCVAPFPICAVISGFPQCVQCVTTEDCERQGAGGCTCTGDPTYACLGSGGSMCNPPFVEPACLVSSDCAGMGSGLCTCTGDPTYQCIEPDGSACLAPTCQAPCVSVADCPSGPAGQALACSGQVGGICFDAAGSCDGQTACCPSGTKCIDLPTWVDAAMAGFAGWPPEGLAPIPSMCSCTELFPCLGDVACTRSDVLCSIPGLADRLCPNGTRPDELPYGVCGNLQPVIDALTSVAGGR